MTHATAMLDTYPADLGNVDKQALADCIDVCFDCAQTCTACADACLSESMVAELTKCIRTNLDCADICDTTGRLLSRHTGYEPTSPPPCCRRAWPRATPAVTNASGTPACTSIAGSAPKPAAAANKPASGWRPRSADPHTSTRGRTDHGARGRTMTGGPARSTTAVRHPRPSRHPRSS
jgi:hypothetical protein